VQTSPAALLILRLARTAKAQNPQGDHSPAGQPPRRQGGIRETAPILPHGQDDHGNLDPDGNFLPESGRKFPL
jgi:hypothetical protein